MPVVDILLVGHVEGLMARVEDKQDDAKGEQVNHLALISLPDKNLRCHVRWGTELCAVSAEAVATLQRAGKAKIDYLNIAIFVEQNILWLKISVREALSMDVLETCEHLFK